MSTTIKLDIDHEPPSTMALTLNAASMLTMNSEDVERLLPVIVLRRLWACQRRHHQELSEALASANKIAEGGK